MRLYAWLAIAGLLFVPALAHAQAAPSPAAPQVAVQPDDLAPQEIAAYEALLKLREAQLVKAVRAGAGELKSANEWWGNCIDSEKCLAWLRTKPAAPSAP